MNPTEVGQTPLEALQATALLLLAQAESFLATFMRPWNFYQIGIALGLFLLAHLLKMALGPRMRDWMRARDGWPTWRMRILIVMHGLYESRSKLLQS